MFITEAKSWRFVSYRRGFPALALTIERDEMIQAAIGEALAGFSERFKAAMDVLIELNGGPPTRTLSTRPLPPTQPQPDPSEMDVPMP